MKNKNTGGFDIIGSGRTKLEETSQFESGLEIIRQLDIKAVVIIGGDEACMKWLAEHLKYPSICQEQGVQGRVFVSFVVNKDGSIVDVEIKRSPDPNLSKEAERVVKSMPKWKPARQGNRTVRSRFNLPVMFRLNN